MEEGRKINPTYKTWIEVEKGKDGYLELDITDSPSAETV